MDKKLDSTKKYPTREECLQMLNDYGTPPHVIRHCYAVTNVALAVAKALNAKGLNLNLDLIMASGMLHDIARVEPNHQEAGANYIESLGMPEVADVVKVHMTHQDFRRAEDSVEADLICVGDRTVVEDTFVGVEKRLDYILNKYSDLPPEVAVRIRSHWDHNRKYVKDIERFLGMPIEEVPGIEDTKM